MFVQELITKPIAYIEIFGYFWKYGNDNKNLETECRSEINMILILDKLQLIYRHKLVTEPMEKSNKPKQNFGLYMLI